MPRLAYVFTDLPAQEGTFAFAELESMAARGFEIEIFCLRSSLAHGPGAEALRGRFPVHRASYLGPATLAAFARAWLDRPGPLWRDLAGAIRQTYRSPAILLKTLAVLPKSCLFAHAARAAGCDLVLSYWASLPGRAARWMSLSSGIPYGTWAHAGNDIYNRAHQTEPALRAIVEGASLVLTCNRANVAYFERILSPRARARVVYHPHGVDLERFDLPAGSAPPVAPREGQHRSARILSVGRLSEAKGFDHAIRAIALLRDRGVAARYRIIGEGKQRIALQALVSELGIEDRVEMPGELEQHLLPREYRAADLFVMPSVIGRGGGRDGLPNVLLEAMACGLAPIGSDAVGIPEAVIPGETGVLVPPGDPGALAGAIERLAPDAVTRARLGENARRLVRERYGREACMDQLAEVLSRALRGEIGSRRESRAVREAS